MISICTIFCNINKAYTSSPIASFCFTRFSQFILIISLNSINRSFFAMRMKSVLCEIETFPQIRETPDPSEKRKYVRKTALECYSYGHVELAVSVYVCVFVYKAFSLWQCYSKWEFPTNNVPWTTIQTGKSESYFQRRVIS